jgi:NAD(P)-dependent dehydrogenase (short-subunit alcohol dehydrogenase family)
MTAPDHHTAAEQQTAPDHHTAPKRQTAPGHHTAAEQRTAPGHHTAGEQLKAVVTGAGGGIGAALARRLAAVGYRVVVNDLDADAARRVADEIGGSAVPGDAADEEVVRALTKDGCNLFCANAGVLGTQDTDAEWERSWRVNVMSHVYAARALLPRWLDDGRGHLLVTVSAAGLLTLLGSAPYSVTKHASLAHAEWLRATYAHRGIKVQALCPQGVRTEMLRDEGKSAIGALLNDTALEAGEVAGRAVAALTGDDFLILPHPEVADYFRMRATDTDRWLRGMNKVQRNFEAA